MHIYIYIFSHLFMGLVPICNAELAPSQVLPQNQVVIDHLVPSFGLQVVVCVHICMIGSM